MHLVDELPDTDASPGLFVTFILKQQACDTHRAESVEQVHLSQQVVIEQINTFLCVMLLDIEVLACYGC